MSIRPNEVTAIVAILMLISSWIWKVFESFSKNPTRQPVENASKLEKISSNKRFKSLLWTITIYLFLFGIMFYGVPSELRSEGSVTRRDIALIVLQGVGLAFWTITFAGSILIDLITSSKPSK